MEQFYKLLKDYNKLLHKNENLPEWHKIYTEENAPAYYEALEKQLKSLKRDYFVLDVGSGLGDIVAMLLNLGYKNILGIERDLNLCKIANKKIKDIFGVNQEYIINVNYPFNTDHIPDIFIQVNNVYAENITNKLQYLSLIKEWIFYNGEPQYAFVELIDSAFSKESMHFPNQVRISEIEVSNLFIDKKIESKVTYMYPENTSTKRLYKIY